VPKARKEYHGIVSYLQQLMHQIESHSSDLLREQECQAFDCKFVAATSAIQDALGKFILIRLSLPDSEENSTILPSTTCRVDCQNCPETILYVCFFVVALSVSFYCIFYVLCV